MALCYVCGSGAGMTPAGLCGHCARQGLVGGGSFRVGDLVQDKKNDYGVVVRLETMEKAYAPPDTLRIRARWAKTEAEALERYRALEAGQAVNDLLHTAASRCRLIRRPAEPARSVDTAELQAWARRVLAGEED